MVRPIALVLALGGSLSIASAVDYPIQPIPFNQVRLTGGFWQQKQEVNRKVTLPFAMQQCEESGRLKNFDLAAEVMQRRAAGEKSFQIKPPTIYPFDDSDVYKAMEGGAYVLSMARDPELERQLDAWIARIAAAQEPDGYLYTFRTMHPDSPGHEWVGQRRWELDPVLSHELYNVGHLYEAGVAYFQATGKRSLLNVCLKNADLLWREFGDDRPAIAPGHQIIEIGMVKLHRISGDARYLKLAQKFLDARGPRGPDYNQRHKPVTEQFEALGHAVRANYMYSGMADVAALTGNKAYLNAIDKIWTNVVEKKLYLTGGVGALSRNEAYGGDYELPADGYNETCATLALMMWNHRMFLLSGDAKYMDVFERSAYNGFLSGVSTSGDRFFYPNPLIYDGSAKNNHGMAGRAPWFGCACCPPNLMRTLASLSGEFYAVRDHEIYVNLYGESEGSLSLGPTKLGLKQSTDYPWQGKVRLEITTSSPVRAALKLRIPGWAQGQPVPTDLYRYESPGSASWKITVNGNPDRPPLQRGYATLSKEWVTGDVIEIEFGLPVQRVRGNDLLPATYERVAFERGPIVYCFESAAAGAGNLSKFTVATTLPTVSESRDEALGRVEVLNLAPGETPASAIPYFAWANRGLRPMVVWSKRLP